MSYSTLQPELNTTEILTTNQTEAFTTENSTAGFELTLTTKEFVVDIEVDPEKVRL